MNLSTLCGILIRWGTAGQRTVSRLFDTHPLGLQIAAAKADSNSPNRLAVLGRYSFANAYVLLNVCICLVATSHAHYAVRGLQVNRYTQCFVVAL